MTFVGREELVVRQLGGASNDVGATASAAVECAPLNPELNPTADFKHSTLHPLWDDFLGTADDTNSAIAQAATLPVADITKAGIADEGVWIKESFDEAQSSAYVSPILLGDGPFTVNAHYTSKGLAVSTARVSLAAERLKTLLNDALR
jgi:hypothetical protein